MLKEVAKIRMAHIHALYIHIYLHQGEWSGPPMIIGSQVHHQTKLNIISDKMSSCGKAVDLTPPQNHENGFKLTRCLHFLSPKPFMSITGPIPMFLVCPFLYPPHIYIHSELSVHFPLPADTHPEGGNCSMCGVVELQHMTRLNP